MLRVAALAIALIVMLVAAGAAAAAPACVIPVDLTREQLEPDVAPARNLRIVPGTAVDLYASAPTAIELPDGSFVSAFAVELTVTRVGFTILRRADGEFGSAGAFWTPPRAGRYQVRGAAVYRLASGDNCEVAVYRTVDVFRRVVRRQVMLRRITGMLIRYQKGIQRLDFRAAARTLDNRLSQLEGLRFRSRRGTAALDRWIAETRRIEALTNRIANRFETGTLSQSLLSDVQTRVDRWTAASKRFSAVVGRLR